MKRLKVVAGLCLILCFTSVAATSAAVTTTTTTATSGTTLVHVKLPSAGITVGYPSTWTPIKGLPKSVLNKTQKLNPQFGDIAKQVPTNAKLYVVDLSNTSFSDNLNVITDDSGGFPASVSDFRQSAEPQFQSIGGTLAGTATVKVSGKTGYEATAQIPVKINETTTITAYTVAVMVPKGDGGTLITISTSDDDTGHALAKQIAASIKIIH